MREQDYLLKRLTIGGHELRTWAGLTTSNGAIVKVDSFKGIVAEAKDRYADVNVKLNGYVVTSGLSTLDLRANDVILVTIKDGDVTQTFKVTVQ
ncbi:hypothetical protein [Ammoniphilus sp. YIM 78166]|uniref:hypothetical protein n=1 Tax=Ammoniphilus sp. YIM 78166 TaxID=1644106 RepID=UPI00106FF70D|nr:hypothetical protein [Ammoniphilus sp. YIM 78166]